MKFFILTLTMSAFSAFADFFQFQIHSDEEYNTMTYLFANDLKTQTSMLDVFQLKQIGDNQLFNTIIFELLSESALKIYNYQNAYDFTFERFQKFEFGKVEVAIENFK